MATSINLKSEGDSIDLVSRGETPNIFRYDYREGEVIGFPILDGSVDIIETDSYDFVAALGLLVEHSLIRLVLTAGRTDRSKNKDQTFALILGEVDQL